MIDLELFTCCCCCRRAVFVIIVCLAMILGVGEYKLFPSQWNRIRGSVMIMAMKLISLAIDLDTGRITKHPPLMPIFGYLFHTATVIFGPWISFYEYFMSIEQQQKQKPNQRVDILDPLWLLSLLRTLILSTMCLVVSSCGLNWYIKRFESKIVHKVCSEPAIVTTRAL